MIDKKKHQKGQHFMKINFHLPIMIFAQTISDCSLSMSENIMFSWGVESRQKFLVLSMLNITE